MRRLIVAITGASGGAYGVQLLRRLRERDDTEIHLLLSAAGVLNAYQELDLKRLAGAVGEKKLKMATQREAEALTGLQVGGISALALLNKGFEICILREAQALSHIVVSAGRRGVDLRLPVRDLLRVTGARLV